MLRNYLLPVLIVFSHLTFANKDGQPADNSRVWLLEPENISLSATFLSYKDGFVFLENNDGDVKKYPLMSLSKQDRDFVMFQDVEIIRASGSEADMPEEAGSLKALNAKTFLPMYGVLFLTGLMILMVVNKNNRSLYLGIAVISMFFLALLS